MTFANDLNIRTTPIILKSLSQERDFEGYASTYTPDNQRDLIMPGAFKASLARWKQKQMLPPLLWQHQTNKPIGIWHSLVEDAKGLYATGRLLLNVAQAKEAYSLLKNRAISGLSIGFQPVISRYDVARKVRKIFKVHLVEISVVTLPANPHACIHQVKSMP